MIRKPVLSSNLRSVGYDAPNKMLEVEFHDGSVYRYENVHAHEHEALTKAASIGKHFHLHIKAKHTHHKHK
jgi:KTSC domain